MWYLVNQAYLNKMFLASVVIALEYSYLRVNFLFLFEWFLFVLPGPRLRIIVNLVGEFID